MAGHIGEIWLGGAHGAAHGEIWCVAGKVRSRKSAQERFVRAKMAQTKFRSIKIRKKTLKKVLPQLPIKTPKAPQSLLKTILKHLKACINIRLALI